MGEPTREGVRTVVLRLRRGHAGDDTLDTSRVLWGKQMNDERKKNDEETEKRRWGMRGLIRTAEQGDNRHFLFV